MAVQPTRWVPIAPPVRLTSSCEVGASCVVRVSFSSARSSTFWVLRLPTVSGAVVPVSV
jgi:hypothetical protein